MRAIDAVWSIVRTEKRDRKMRLTQWLEEFQDDVRSGLHQLTHSPAFTLVAGLTLALGIGANAAVFAVVKSVLVDALPYDDADRLVRVHGGLRDGSQERGPLSAGTVNDLARRQRSFSSLGAFVDLAFDAVYGADGGPQVAKVVWVEPAFFETLGVRAARGRTFQRDEAESGFVPLSGGQLAPDTAPTVLVTHTAWVRLFGSDPQVLGRTVRINGISRSVIGVLPSSFIGPMGNADFYFAFDIRPVLDNPIAVRRSHWLGLVGRLKPGVTHDAAEREIASIWNQLVREYPADNGTLRVSAMPLRDAMVGDSRTRLLVVMASAGLVLLITCANLAGALLSRTLSRRKEFAIRSALGARRGRLVRQLLTESTVLALAGGTAGLLLAVITLDVLGGLASQALPDYTHLSLDWRVVLVTVMLALVTGLAFGLAPALSVDRSDIQITLRDETRGAIESRRSRHLRGALVAGQMALCISLLAGAGLLVRSLLAMTTAPLGFDPNGVLTARVQLPARTYSTPEARALFREEFMDRLRALPGVDAVATSTSIPTAVRQRMGIGIESTPPGDAQPFVLATVVSDDYFRTLRIPLRQGRTFDARDRANAPPTVVISENAARRYWPLGNAVGSRIRLGPDRNAPLTEVIGIVGDVRNDRARLDAEPMAYGSIRQIPAPVLTVMLRAKTDPLGLVRAIERELAAIDPGIPLERPMTLNAVLGEGLAGRRLPVLLMTAFGALALLLASVGVYAMFTSMAAAREREFGVRMALGSRPRAIAGLVLRQGVGWMAAGLALGALGTIVVIRLVRDLLYGVQPFDPLTLGLSVAILVACATIALLVPLRRATRVDPAIALRAQ